MFWTTNNLCFIAITCLQAPYFCWGPYDGQTFIGIITAAYNEVVHWKRNLVLVPSGSPSKAFVSDLARLLEAIADDGSSLEGIAMMACTILQALLLQKSSRNSKDHVSTWIRGLIYGKRVTFNHSLRKGDVFRNISRNFENHLMMMQ